MRLALNQMWKSGGRRIWLPVIWEQETEVMKFGYKLLLLAGLLSSPLANAVTYFSATVTATGTYGSGSIYIFLSSTINEPGCAASRIDVSNTHPQVKQILAIAMAAKVSGQTVVGQVNGCDSATGNPTFDTSYQSYIYLQ